MIGLTFFLIEIKVNKDDGAAIKRVLDDSVVNYLTQEKHFAENTKISNWKLLLGVISIALAITAQFYPAPFPENYNILVVCCSAYFVCSSILQYITSYKEKDYILFLQVMDLLYFYCLII